MRRILFSVLIALIMITGLSGSVIAATPVARVSLIQGEASLLRGDYDKWVPASINTPLMAGDRIYSGEQSRAELTVAPLQYLRIANDTSVELLNFLPALVQIKVGLGTATIYANKFDPKRTLEIDTPNIAITVLSRGLYRVDVDQAGNTTITVWQGEVTASANGGNFTIRGGEGAYVQGVETPQYEITAAALEDDWDRWNLTRNRRTEAVVSTKYVNEDIYGTADLDQYGQWVSVPTYGRAWVPAGVGPDWAPYSDGRWMWQDPFGWTWVSYEPWGWAPYHYGRWSHFRGIGWGWIPQPVHVRPYYAPALVSFVWSGRGGAVGISVGASPFVGWFPLSPRDVYVPTYASTYYTAPRAGISIATRSFGFSLYFERSAPYYYNAGFASVPAVARPSTTVINQYNYTNIQNISVTKNVYVNQTVNNAVVTTTTQGFTSGRIERVAVDRRETRRERVISQALPVAPTQTSLAPSARVDTPRHIPSREVLARPAMALNQPAPVPVHFERKIKAIEERGGRPVLPAETPKAAEVKGGKTQPVPTAALQPVVPVRLANKPEAGMKPPTPTQGILPKERRRVMAPAEAEKPVVRGTPPSALPKPEGQAPASGGPTAGGTVREGQKVMPPAGQQPGQQPPIVREQKPGPTTTGQGQQVQPPADQIKPLAPGKQPGEVTKGPEGQPQGPSGQPPTIRQQPQGQSGQGAQPPSGERQVGRPMPGEQGGSGKPLAPAEQKPGEKLRPLVPAGTPGQPPATGQGSQGQSPTGQLKPLGPAKQPGEVTKEQSPQRPPQGPLSPASPGQSPTPPSRMESKPQPLPAQRPEVAPTPESEKSRDKLKPFQRPPESSGQGAPTSRSETQPKLSPGQEQGSKGRPTGRFDRPAEPAPGPRPEVQQPQAPPRQIPPERVRPVAPPPERVPPQAEQAPTTRRQESAQPPQRPQPQPQPQPSPAQPVQPAPVVQPQKPARPPAVVQQPARPVQPPQPVSPAPQVKQPQPPPQAVTPPPAQPTPPAQQAPAEVKKKQKDGEQQPTQEDEEQKKGRGSRR